jgi:hypothetical protein
MFLLDFNHGASNYEKATYLENRKAQAFWIKEPLPVL